MLFTHAHSRFVGVIGWVAVSAAAGVGTFLCKNSSRNRSISPAAISRSAALQMQVGAPVKEAGTFPGV